MLRGYGIDAGKTSLLSVLADKAFYGIQTGMIMVNGRPESLSRFKRIMGFVPQVSIRTFQPSSCIHSYQMVDL